MAVTDPRERYDDLLVVESREVLEPDAFEHATNSDAARHGWIALALTFDDAGRVLLIQQPWADGWMAPGGTLEPGETLAETARREVREETGVEVTPVRPHSVEELTFEHERTGETDGWNAVVFEAEAETTEVDDDPGMEDEEIEAVRWFGDLPEVVFNRELTARVYRRCDLAGGEP